VAVSTTAGRTPGDGIHLLALRYTPHRDGYPNAIGRGSGMPPRNHRPDPQQEAIVRIGAVIAVIWLLIGLLAAGQRGYLSGSSSNCAKAGNTVITIVAGPLNYVGINPKVRCDVPQPSK
jgi:hypothetical protein